MDSIFSNVASFQKVCNIYVLIANKSLIREFIKVSNKKMSEVRIDISDKVVIDKDYQVVTITCPIETEDKLVDILQRLCEKREFDFVIDSEFENMTNAYYRQKSKVSSRDLRVRDIIFALLQSIYLFPERIRKLLKFYK